MLIALLIGFAFGFIGSMPVAGPIAVLVFARGVESRFRSGIAIAAGGAVAEGAYAFLAFWGFSHLLSRYAFILPASRAAAALILIGLGIVFVRSKPVKKEPAPRKQRFGGDLVGGLALGFTITALNPTLIATWTAAATTLFSTGLVAFDSDLAVPFGGGAMLGIVCWFALLLLLVRRFRGHFSETTLTKIIRAMGAFLLAIGVYFAVLFVHHWL